MSDPYIPDNKWIKCNSCNKILYNEDFVNNLYVCPNCNNHARLSAKERIKQIVDAKTFKEMYSNLNSIDFLKVPHYYEKLVMAKSNTNMNEAVICGTGKINDIKVAIAVMDSNFLMGSMGSVVGEKITRITEYATSKKLPLVIFSASGGARMQEGIISLMQMAKTSQAIKKHSDKGLLYISVLTDPTAGGVTASFASLGDVNISEPNSTICFAGARVIKGTINEKLPDNFQKSEFLLEAGFLDMIVERNNMKNSISNILSAFDKKGK